MLEINVLLPENLSIKYFRILTFSSFLLPDFRNVVQSADVTLASKGLWQHSVPSQTNNWNKWIFILSVMSRFNFYFYETWEQISSATKLMKTLVSEFLGFWSYNGRWRRADFSQLVWQDLNDCLNKEPVFTNSKKIVQLKKIHYEFGSIFSSVFS